METHLSAADTRHRRAHNTGRIPLALAPGERINLPRGVQNSLVRKLINEFCPRFTPGAVPVYIGDAAGGWAYFNAIYLRDLGVTVQNLDEMPDVVVHLAAGNLLFLIQARMGLGLVSANRVRDLISLFSGVRSGLCFVGAFLNRRAVSQHCEDIAWGTHVWAADAPDHMIHFDGNLTQS